MSDGSLHRMSDDKRRTLKEYLTEAGWPDAVTDDGLLIDIDLPPEVYLSAWSLSGADGGVFVSMDQFISYALHSDGPKSWFKYFKHHGLI